MAYKYDPDLNFLEEEGNDELRMLFNSLIYYRKKLINKNFYEHWKRIIVESSFYKKNTPKTTYKEITESIAEELSIENYKNYSLEKLEEQIFKKIFLIITFQDNEIEKMIFNPESEKAELKNKIFLYDGISLKKVTFLYLSHILRNYNPKIISEFLISPFMLFVNKNLEEKFPKLIIRLMISFIILVSVLRNARKIFNKNDFIENKNIVCDIRKKYSEISLLQMEMLDLFEKLKIIDEKTQNKILKIIKISKYFEGTINGYYIKIEYSKSSESIIKIIKK